MLDFIWDIVLPVIGLLCVVFFILMMFIVWDKNDADCLTESDLYNKYHKGE